jgi:hypothetical protein
VINTPSNHRVHHSMQPEHIDKNYAGVLVLWDKLFGTYVPEADRIREFGIAGAPATRNPVRIVMSPWFGLFRRAAASRGVLPRLRVLFGPPGAAPQLTYDSLPQDAQAQEAAA